MFCIYLLLFRFLAPGLSASHVAFGWKLVLLFFMGRKGVLMRNLWGALLGLMTVNPSVFYLHPSRADPPESRAEPIRPAGIGCCLPFSSQYCTFPCCRNDTLHSLYRCKQHVNWKHFGASLLRLEQLGSRFWVPLRVMVSLGGNRGNLPSVKDDRVRVPSRAGT